MKLPMLIMIWCVESVHQGINKLTSSISYTQEKFHCVDRQGKAKKKKCNIHCIFVAKSL